MKFKVGDVVFSTIWEKDVIIRGVRPNLIYEVADIEYLSRFMYTHELNLKSREEDIEKDMEEHQKIVNEIMTIQGIEPIEAEIEEVWHCPEGYIFKDENGNIINATKIVLEKKKKEYPKTYAECCDVLSIQSYYKLRYYTYEHDYNEYATSNKLCSLSDKLNILGKLLICRDTYWKIAGEEMGLRKPWEPDWKNHNIKYVLFNQEGEIDSMNTSGPRNYILAFPTTEMRDAFYENFKELIEQCKELL